MLQQAHDDHRIDRTDDRRRAGAKSDNPADDSDAATGNPAGGAAGHAGVKAAERAAQSSPSMAAGDAKFINAQATDQWLSSNFIGVDVVGPDNEKIGDVTDILFEKNGNVVGYVVGVGGFLGIGAKNVALAPTSFQVVRGYAIARPPDRPRPPRHAPTMSS